jgi:hypothetical protein
MLLLGSFTRLVVLAYFTATHRNLLMRCYAAVQQHWRLEGIAGNCGHAVE